MDIPSYDVLHPKTGNIIENGTYLIPVVWNERLLIFFPQIIKKTRPMQIDSIDVHTKIERNVVGEQETETGSTTSIPLNKPDEYWEIKMAWSEYRNGNWTQKQVSTE